MPWPAVAGVKLKVPPFAVAWAFCGAIELVPDDLGRALHRLTGWALEAGVDVGSLEIVRPTLEDVYLELTGSAASGGADGQGISEEPASAPVNRRLGPRVVRRRR